MKLCTVHRTSVQETVEDPSQSVILFSSKVRAPDMDPVPFSNSEARKPKGIPCLFFCIIGNSSFWKKAEKKKVVKEGVSKQTVGDQKI